MTREVLKGGASGANRAAIIATAREVAALYFGTKCVDVRLRDAEGDRIDRKGEEVTGVFHANFDAQEHHPLTQPAYGFAQCPRCGRDEARGPLPRADWDADTPA